MRIIVCVKAVPGSTEVRMDPKTNTIVRDGGQAVMNPFDAAALEIALAVRDERAEVGRETHVTALSMGIPDTARILRDCVARGADDAILLSDRAFAGADTLATAYALSLGVRHCGSLPDLIVCGKMAVDGDTAQIGPELAGELGIPCVAGVIELVSHADGVLVCRRDTDEGVEEVEVSLPALITVAKDAAQLRMPSIAGVRAEDCARIEVLDAEAAGADRSRIGLTGSPTQVVRSFVPERGDDTVTLEGDVRAQAAAVLTLAEEMGL